MYGYIYKTTNLIDGKFYIGQHQAEGFDEGYYGSGVHLRRAIKKYGKENFLVEIMQICESQKELDAAEVWWIRELDATVEGYNIAPGGPGSGHERSVLTRQRMSEGQRKRRGVYEDAENIIKDCVSGKYTWSVVCKKHHVSDETLKRLLKENGVEFRKRPTLREKWKDKEEELREKFKYKGSKELADEYGVSVKEMLKVLDVFEVRQGKVDQNRKRFREKINEIRRRLKNGEAMRLIAEDLKIPLSYISEERKKIFGVSIPETIKTGLDKSRLEELFIIENKTAKEIAEIYGVKKSTIVGLLNRWRIKKGCDKKWTEEEIEEVGKLYGKGFSKDEIAEKLAVTLPSVSSIIQRYGFRSPKAAYGYTEEEKRIVYELYYLKGMYAKEVCKIIGRSEHAVREIASKNGWIKEPKYRNKKCKNMVE